MAQTWPGTLPDKVESSNFSYNLGSSVMRSQMDIGPEKVRRRMTRAVNTMTCAMLLTSTQQSTLESFYVTTLNGGILTFNFNHPITQVSTEWRFIAPPKFNHVGGLVFSVSMAWEEII